MTQRYPLIHKPNNPVRLPQITTPVIGEGRHILIAGGTYGHVILQLEPNPQNDGCYMLWSITPDATPHLLADALLTTQFLDAVYEGLCEAITEEGKGSNGIRYVPFPYENTNVRIMGGSEHPVDSRAGSYRRAAYLALADAVSKLE